MASTVGITHFQGTIAFAYSTLSECEGGRTDYWAIGTLTKAEPGNLGRRRVARLQAFFNFIDMHMVCDRSSRKLHSISCNAYRDVSQEIKSGPQATLSGQSFLRLT